MMCTIRPSPCLSSEVPKIIKLTVSQILVSFPPKYHHTTYNNMHTRSTTIGLDYSGAYNAILDCSHAHNINMACIFGHQLMSVLLPIPHHQFGLPFRPTNYVWITPRFVGFHTEQYRLNPIVLCRHMQQIRSHNSKQTIMQIQQITTTQQHPILGYIT